MIVFTHTKFDLVGIQESGVKRGKESVPPQSERASNLGPDRVKKQNISFRQVRLEP